MGVPTNLLPPSLLAELQEIKRRLAAQERAPAPDAKFDRYPTTEWAAVSRGRVPSNAWSSCGIANVTGLVYDRVELKFLVDRLTTNQAEAELRVAAFKHNGTSKECVSASRSIRLRGAASPGVGTVVVRWVHGIPYGWDYSTGDSVYTIEVQHRYLVGPSTGGSGWDGNYAIGNMHYCVGLPDSRISATPNGTWMPSGVGIVNDGTAGNVSDPFI
ncbi:hypothetical protein ACFWIP_02965 [Streptomyces anulatus]|uniref:hypothetical protein n=1 Tax=Streptomyces anulatus TaxID=1892 RepID=UPI00365CCCFE